MLRVFLHGLESSNQGTKSAFFRERYPDMRIPNFSGPLKDRMEKLEKELEGENDLCIVGSSFGGLMATLFALEHEDRLERLILLAPAINLLREIPHGGDALSVPVWIFHGREDDVIPIDDVRKEAPRLFQNLRFHELDDDHSLHRRFASLEWDTLLGS